MSFPKLAGISEIAEQLGVSRQRASQLQYHPDFPKPVARLKLGPVWRLNDIVKFQGTWTRKPGRPKVNRERTS